MPKIYSTFEIIQKTYEYSYNGKVKPRCIFNPHASLKANLGYYNKYWIANIRRILPEIIVGLNTSSITNII